MSGKILYPAGALVLAACFGWRVATPARDEIVRTKELSIPEASPLCPWRAPQTDLKALFPNATRFEPQTLILSGLRLSLAQRLEPGAPLENALRVFRIFDGEEPLGTVLTQRVKGQYGAIELVLALDSHNAVRALQFQRLREPDAVARAIEEPSWRRCFEGKTAESRWELGREIPDVRPEARISARAVVEGVHRTLITLALAEQNRLKPVPALHHE